MECLKKAVQKKKKNGSVYIWVWSDRALPMELLRVNQLARISAHNSMPTLSSLRGRKSLQSVLFSLSLWVICSVWGRVTGNKWGRALRSINFRQLTSVNSWRKIRFPWSNGMWISTIILTKFIPQVLQFLSRTHGLKISVAKLGSSKKYFF